MKKKYIEFTPEDREEIVKTYHDWQSIEKDKNYHDIKEYCVSIKKEELIDYSLVPSKYIEFKNDIVDSDFYEDMKEIQVELKDLLLEQQESYENLKKIMEELGYGI